jgi:site-specific recombinase XerD
MLTASLAHLLRRFFCDWLVGQRNASPNTVASYRDTWRLFLRFVSGHLQRSVSSLKTEELTAHEILAFLEDCEVVRKCALGTRNCRLAALHSFFSFVASREPMLAQQCVEVLQIPRKQAPQPGVRSLDREEREAISKQPDQDTLEGQRDYVLLALMYNTGIRIQEALDLVSKDVRLTHPAQIHVVGKGRKERFCPLWPETVNLLKEFLKRQPKSEEDRIFLNRYGKPLTASGVRFKLHRYVTVAAKLTPSLRNKHVSPHLYRHTTAVDLVAANVDIAIISSLLGHADLRTTYRYAQADLETKRRALETVHDRPSAPPRWNKESELLGWLNSL